MRDHRPVSTETILSKSTMSQLQARAQEISALNNAIQSILSTNITEHCRVANIKSSTLILEVTSAAIKMRLDRDRLYLLNQLRQQGYARLISIEIKINPSLYRVQPRVKEKPEHSLSPPISDTTASYLRIIAHHAPDKLKKRLESLAQLAQSKT